MIGERLGILDQFQGVDLLEIEQDGGFRVLERIEGGIHQVSRCAGPPVMVGWATGSLGEPPNQPQIGMQNMRAILPALQRAKAAGLAGGAIEYRSAAIPKQQRETRVVKDLPAGEIAAEIAEWIKG
jgi:electron transfer flavoprotein beta subunit